MRFELGEDLDAILAALDALLGAKADAGELLRADTRAARRARLDQALDAFGLEALMAQDAEARQGLLGLATACERLAYHAAPSAPVIAAYAADFAKAAFGEEAGSGRIALAVQTEETPTFAWVESADRAERILFVAGAELSLAAARDCAASPQHSADVTRDFFRVSSRRLLACATDAQAAGRVIDGLRVLLAADAYGAGARALAMAVEYAKVRRQFDRPIGAFQALKHQLANAAIDLEPSRFLYWKAAHAWDRSDPNAPLLAALAHAHCGESAVSATRVAVEAHGAIGFTWDYPLHLFVKRAAFGRARLGGTMAARELSAARAGW